MYDINYSNIKKGRMVWYIFIFVALVFIGIMGFIAFTTLSKQKTLTGEATSYKYEFSSYYNDDGNKMYTPIYYYQVNGEEYTCSSSFSSSSPSGEKNKIIYYLPSDPEQCSTGFDMPIWFILLFTLIPLLFIVLGVVGISKNAKKVKSVKELNQIGKLVKKIPCRVEDSNITINNRRIPRIVMEYQLRDGSFVTLTSEPIYDKRFVNDGFADLVIDENDPSRYYIDKNINRIDGNRAEDYYNLDNSNNANITNETQFVSSFDI